MIKHAPWTEEEIKILKKIFPLSKYTLKDISKLLPTRTVCAITEKAYKLNLKTERKKTRKYKINEHYFDQIDTEEKSYWLGFIMADGCVHKNTLSIGLQSGDKGHIEKFRNSIGSTHKINTRLNKDGYSKSGTYSSRICVSNKYMVNVLKKIGIMERKTYYAKPLNCIPEEFEKDFWRGMIDGDGHISIHKRFRKESGNMTDNFVYLNLTGTKDICQGFKNFCNKYIQTNAKIRKSEGCYNFSLAHNNAFQITKILYENSTMYLDRKYEKALNIIDETRLMISIEESFGYNYPDLLEEWNYELNIKIDPIRISPQSHFKFMWTCKEHGHIWEAAMYHRTKNKSGCPECYKIRENRKTWTENDYKLLKKMYADLTFTKENMEKTLKCSYAALQFQASNVLGIKRPTNVIYHGIIKRKKVYESYIHFNNSQCSLGTYKKIEDALEIRKMAEKMKENGIKNLEEYKDLRKKFKKSIKISQ